MQIKMFFAKICRSEYKDVLCNEKCLRNQLIKVEVRIIEQDLIKSTKFIYHAFNAIYMLALGA